jgi:hypothetical protein
MTEKPSFAMLTTNHRTGFLDRHAEDGSMDSGVGDSPANGRISLTPISE